jgi:hypothetical protein
LARQRKEAHGAASAKVMLHGTSMLSKGFNVKAPGIRSLALSWYGDIMWGFSQGTKSALKPLGTSPPFFGSPSCPSWLCK